jgi:sodium--glutamate symport carrier gltS
MLPFRQASPIGPGARFCHLSRGGPALFILIGGNGTSIAWAPTFAEQFQIENALEIGIAAATFGMVLASASGGPIAQFLLRQVHEPCLDGEAAIWMASNFMHETGR